MSNFIRQAIIGIIRIGLVILCTYVILYVIIESAPPPSTPIPRTGTPTHIPPTTTPIPPSFRGRLIVGSSEGVFALISDPATGEIKEIETIKMLTSYEGAISPDNHYLLSTKGMAQDTAGIVVVDLSTFETTTLIDNAYCPQWAADSKRFSYISLGGLYVYDIDTGNSDLIWQAPSAVYYGIGGGTLYGSVECGFWIGSDRLLFERFLGLMPSRIGDGAGSLAANTTTLAILGDNLELIDSPELLHIIDVTKEGDYLLLEKNGLMYITNSFKDFAGLNLRSLASLPIDQERFGVFLPNSNQIMVENREMIYFIDPKSREISRTFAKPPDDYSFVIGYGWMDTTFMGDPNEGTYLSIHHNPSRIDIGNLSTGVKTELWDASKYRSLEWLVWIP